MTLFGLSSGVVEWLALLKFRLGGNQGWAWHGFRSYRSYRFRQRNYLTHAALLLGPWFWSFILRGHPAASRPLRRSNKSLQDGQCAHARCNQMLRRQIRMHEKFTGADQQDHPPRDGHQHTQQTGHVLKEAGHRSDYPTSYGNPPDKR